MTLETLGAWVIECNARLTPIEPMLAAGAAKDAWCVAANYRTRLMRPGQRVLFWVSGHARRGIWGAGVIAGEVSTDAAGQRHVPVDLSLFAEPVTAADLASIPGLRTLEVLRSPQQANPSWVSGDEWAALAPLLPAGCARMAR